MALRQFIAKGCRPMWAFVSSVEENAMKTKNHLPKPTILPLASKSPLTERSKILVKPPAPKGKCLLTNTTILSPSSSTTFIDLFTNNAHQKLHMPTVAINQLQVYEDLANTKKDILDPLVGDKTIEDKPVPGLPLKKECVRMILIRRRKMRKHKLRKLRKKMRFVWAKVKLRREIRKEQAFRVELLSQIEVAEQFQAKAYVEGVIEKIRLRPKPKTQDMIYEEYRLLRKKNRSAYSFIVPRFDDVKTE